MDLDLLRSNGFDVDGAVARFVGNVGLYERFLKKFLEDTSYEAYTAAMQAKDYAAAEIAIHTLKGVAGNLGVPIYQDSIRILADIRHGEYAAAAEESEAFAVKFAHDVDVIMRAI